jgi:hypothetical protein
MNKRNLIIAATAAALFTTGVYAAEGVDSKAGNNAADAKYDKNGCKGQNRCYAEGKNSSKGDQKSQSKPPCRQQR